MSPRAKQILRWAGYVGFYLLSLACFVKCTFPYERLKDRVVLEFNSRQTGPLPLELSIGEMSSYWLTGVEAENVRLKQPAPASAMAGSAAADGKESEKSTERVTEIEHVHVSVSLLRLLFGSTKLSFGADALGGELSGEMIQSESERTLELDLDGLDVGQLPVVAEAVGLPLKGSLRGSIELDMPEQKLSKANGTIKLEATELTVGDGKAKIRDTIALPTLNAGELKLEGEVVDGVFKLDQFTVQGPDLELSAQGEIRLRDPADQSLVQMTLRFKFADSYKNKNDMTRGLFGAPGSNVPGVFDLDPKIRQAKGTDGFYGFRLSGSIGRLSTTAASSASAAAGNRLPPPRRGRSTTSDEVEPEEPAPEPSD